VIGANYTGHRNDKDRQPFQTGHKRGKKNGKGRCPIILLRKDTTTKKVEKKGEERQVTADKEKER